LKIEGTVPVEFDTTIRLTVFFSVIGLMASWEMFAPRRRLETPRAKRWRANVSVAALNTLVVRTLFSSGAVGFALVAANQGWGLLNAVQWPFWVEGLLAFAVLDLAIYLQHILFHRVPGLWSFHMVHHTDTDYDVTTGIRFHPVEMVLSMLLKSAAAVLVGASSISVLIFEIVLNASSMFNHGNVHIPQSVDRMLRWFVVTPDMHRIHHSILHQEANQNFGFNLSWWDYLFGTYLANPSRGQQHMTFGLKLFRSSACLELRNMLKIPFRRLARNTDSTQQQCV
jgi:sterol desaturase/sphingolipid hydroxylase (fatty acid hydroxylase superfamily)